MVEGGGAGGGSGCHQIGERWGRGEGGEDFDGETDGIGCERGQGTGMG